MKANMNVAIILAKETYLSGLTFHDACRSAFFVCKGHPVYDCIAQGILRISGKEWEPNYFMKFSDAKHPHEMYLRVFDEALASIVRV